MMKDVENPIQLKEAHSSQETPERNEERVESLEIEPGPNPVVENSLKLLNFPSYRLIFGAVLLLLIAIIIPPIVVYVAYRNNNTSDSVTVTYVATEVPMNEKIAYVEANACNITQYYSSDDDNYADLACFGEKIGNASIIFLGENHGDGTVDILRTRLIKYLHSKLGFNTLAWEAGPYDAYQTYQKILSLDSSNATTENLEIIIENMFAAPYWGWVNETQEIFQYMLEQAHTTTPLELVGFDYSGAGNLPYWYPYLFGNLQAYPELESFLNTYIPSDQQPSAFYYEILKNITNNVYFFGYPLPSENNINFFFSELNRTINYLVSVSNQYNSNNFDMWVLIYNQTAATARDAFIWGPACSIQPPSYSTCNNVEYLMNNRDVQMATNIRWFMESKRGSLVSITNRKIIIWSGNSHGAVNLSSISDGAYQFSYCKGINPCPTVRAGTKIKEWYGNQAIMVATTSFQGSSGSSITPCEETTPYTTYPTTIYGSMEYLFYAAGFPNAAYLDLSNKSALPSWLSSEDNGFHFDSDSNDPIPMITNIPALYDAVLYFENMAGITCLNLTSILPSSSG